MGTHAPGCKQFTKFTGAVWERMPVSTSHSPIFGKIIQGCFFSRHLVINKSVSFGGQCFKK